jgi:hypothetical protein
MKRGNPEPLTPKLQAELDALAAMPDSEIDTTDMPPITDILDWFQRQGQGYQTRMNFALREYVERHRKRA